MFPFLNKNEALQQHAVLLMYYLNSNLKNKKMVRAEVNEDEQTLTLTCLSTSVTLILDGENDLLAIAKQVSELLETIDTLAELDIFETAKKLKVGAGGSKLLTFKKINKDVLKLKKYGG